MQITTVTAVCVISLAIRSVSGHAINQDDNRAEDYERDDWKEPRALKSESVLMGIAKSLIGGKIGATGGGQNHYCVDPDVNKRSIRGFCKLSSLTTLSSPCKFFKMANGFCDLPDILVNGIKIPKKIKSPRDKHFVNIFGSGPVVGYSSLSLNMSNIVLMLVLRGLIWGVSYMQGDGGKEARNEDATSVGGLLDDAITETDVMLFLGYLVADESGHSGCLNRVACEQPDRADRYLKAAETIWQTAKMFDGAVPLDAKYETILVGLHGAIEDGRAVGGDCRSKYKCFGSHTSDDADHFNLT